MAPSPEVARCLVTGLSTAPLGFLAGKGLEAGPDHVAVQGVQLHEEGRPTRLLGGDQRAATAAEQVEDVLAGLARVLHRPCRQLDGFLSLRVNRHRSTSSWFGR